MVIFIVLPLLFLFIFVCLKRTNNNVFYSCDATQCWLWWQHTKINDQFTYAFCSITNTKKSPPSNCFSFLLFNSIFPKLNLKSNYLSLSLIYYCKHSIINHFQYFSLLHPFQLGNIVSAHLFRLLPCPILAKRRNFELKTNFHFEYFLPCEIEKMRFFCQ